jgi:hypothetical protein
MAASKIQHTESHHELVLDPTMDMDAYFPARFSFGSPVSVMENVLAMDCGSRPTAG